ncbi:thiamine-phosphate kinase [Paludibacterium paludis]|uniref:Thiamine-monophosphate kinase n=1 Tax=Paludibacterium paludis TaxID=1225769 RepID=A0A918UAA9_9NEIS|nr:thiamine-phosphate kinase [Paludibacterium paludis]GGY20612.1 thiamine-monophosphate kinase [Paludibacterium paludis]
MNEFDLIREFFTHRADSVVLGVGDDAAILAPSPGHELVVSADMLVEGRHFFADVDPARLGHKCLAVNLSDMAAMGARPRWVFLSLALPNLDRDWLAGFSAGFMGLAGRHGVALAGGDTTRGPLTVSVTIMGEAPDGTALRRSGARAGDEIWVSGRLGLAAAAVRHRLEGVALPAEVLDAALADLERPEPRVALGLALRGIASCAIDISDGLLADAGHLADRSGVGIDLLLESVPTHPWLAMRRLAWRDCLAAGGDDYELCFAAPAAQRQRIEALSTPTCPLTRIGRVVSGEGVRLLDAGGNPLTMGRQGFDHFECKA